MSHRTRGLFRKFIVKRTDGTSEVGQKHDGCEYFVLDMTHDPYAKAAAAAYVDACQADYPLLAADMVRDFKLRADALAPLEPGWQSVTAVSPAREAELWFWIRPKTADETYHDTSGKPILSATPPRLFIGKRGTWPSLMTATHWMEPRWPAPPRADALEAPRSDKVKEGNTETRGGSQ